MNCGKCKGNFKVREPKEAEVEENGAEIMEDTDGVISYT